MKKKRPHPDKPLTDSEWKKLGPAMRGVDGLPPAARKAIRKTVGRPRLARPKEKVTVRLDADILAAFRAQGKGWQTLLNAMLREHMP